MASTSDFTGPVSVWQQIERRAISEPERLAIVSPHRSHMSYQQLWTRMESLAGRLRTEGLAFGATVALMLPEGPHSLATILAVSRNFACAPMNPALTAAEQMAYLRELAPDALLTAPEFPIAAEIGTQLGTTVLEAHEESSGLEAEWRLLHKGRPSGVTREEVGVILQTSATTGRSKLVGLSRSNLQASIQSTRSALQLGSEDRVLLLTPLFHLQAILSAMSQLAVGGSAVVPCGFSRDDFVWWLDRLTPTWYTCGPTMHRAICSLMEGIAPQAPGLRPRSLRFVRSIGAPLSPQLAAQLTHVLGAPVLNGYGMTETGVVTSIPVHCARERADSVGRSTGTEIQIWDADGTETAPDTEGEIVLRGSNVVSGYINDPDANSSSFRNGWFRSGDLGRLDADGFLYITGRLKEQINRGGEKINPSEVDDVLALHPSVDAVAAFALEHPSLGEDVACAVVLRSHALTTTAAELRGFAAQRLASFKAPRSIFYVETIPRGATGKPQRHVLAQQFKNSNTAATGSSVAPNHLAQIQPLDIQQQILAVWRDLLGRNDLSLDENFFSAGGDSMQAVVMLSAIEQVTGLKAVLSTESFFHDPTILHLAEMIEALKEWETLNSPSEKVVVVPVQDGTVTVTDGQGSHHLYLFPPDTQDGTAFRRLAIALGPKWSVGVVRPGHMRHRNSAHVIEHAAKESVEAIRAGRPDGPYLLGGFCFGGIIAFEASRLLRQQGFEVKLVLFDTPVPGYPQLFWKVNFAAEHWRVMRATLSDALRRQQVKAFAVLVVRKTTWNAILLSKPFYAKVSNLRMVNWMATRAKMDDLPFFRVHDTPVPILHLLATERSGPLLRGAYGAWKQVAKGGLTEIELLGNHVTLFTTANLSQLANAIRSWVQASNGTGG